LNLPATYQHPISLVQPGETLQSRNSLNLLESSTKFALTAEELRWYSRGSMNSPCPCHGCIAASQAKGPPRVQSQQLMQHKVTQFRSARLSFFLTRAKISRLAVHGRALPSVVCPSPDNTALVEKASICNSLSIPIARLTLPYLLSWFPSSFVFPFPLVDSFFRAFVLYAFGDDTPHKVWSGFAAHRSRAGSDFSSDGRGGLLENRTPDTAIHLAPARACAVLCTLL